MHSNIDDFFGDSEQNIEFAQELLSKSKIIYVYRDGRDVMNSLYTYVTYHNPEFSEMLFGDFLRMDNEFDHWTYDGTLNRVEYWAFHVNGWLSRQDVFFTTFERITSHYEKWIQEIAQYLDEPCPKNIVSVLRKSSSSSPAKTDLAQRIRELFLRKVKKVNYSSIAFSRGKSGGYLDTFSDDDIRYFDEFAGPLLQDLGFLTPAPYKPQ